MSLPDTAPRSFGNHQIQDLSSGRIRRALRTVREKGPLHILALARRHGLRKSASFAAQNVRHMIAHRLALRWDRRHGVDTAGSIQLHSLSIVGPNKKFGNECVCTSPRSFDFMMRCLPRDLSDYTFVDIGSGKSRTLLLASQHNFCKIVGVEFARELVDCSKRNIARFKSPRQKCCNFAMIEADATAFAIPDTPLVIFFYNPFSREVFDVVLANILASLEGKTRNCYIIYGSSSHNAIEWARPAILASGRFEELPAEPMPLFFDALRRVDYAAFRAM
jgi:hypothetical protein